MNDQLTMSKPEGESTETLQLSRHHINNSAVSLLFRLVGGFFLIESAYVILFAVALATDSAQYYGSIIRLLWIAFTFKFIIEAFFIGLCAGGWASVNYYISNGHLIRYRGIRRRDENVYDLSILKTVELHQGWWGRAFNYGDIKLVFSSSGYLESFTLYAIYNPKKYERILKEKLNTTQTSKINEPWARASTAV